MLNLWLLLALSTSLPFYEDSYATALSAAQKANQPLVVYLWASWCHSCLSMQNIVMKEPAVQALTPRATFLSLETDRPANRSTVNKLRLSAWPTFIILDPSDETVLARLLGSATANEFVAFVEQGGAAFAAKKQHQTDSPLLALAAADAADLKGDHDAAGAVYAKALANPSLPQKARARAAYAESFALRQAGKYGACAAHAKKSADTLPQSYFTLALLATYFDCAMSTEDKLTSAELAELFSAVRRNVDDAKLALTVDDKSDLLGMLASIAELRHDKTTANNIRLERLALLENAASHAPDKITAHIYDANRAELYVDLGRVDEAIQMLNASEKDSPTDYNPPARLARAYFAKGELGAAKAAIQRAKGLVYGPRMAVIELLAGDIALKAGDPTSATKDYEHAKSIWEKEPQTISIATRLKDINQRIANLHDKDEVKTN